jgi:hypothetical protein
MSALFVLDSLFASACDSSEPFDSFVRMLARSAGSLELGVGVFPRHPGTRRPLLGDERTICPRVPKLRPRCVRAGLAATSQTSNLIDEEVSHIRKLWELWDASPPSPNAPTPPMGECWNCALWPRAARPPGLKRGGLASYETLRRPIEESIQSKATDCRLTRT